MKYHKNRRKFFETYASTRSFDPLIPANWYKENMLGHLKHDKITLEILSIYGGSLVRALIHLFPEVQFDPARFSSAVKRNYWGNEANRRKFFVDFAAKNKFDPLVPENWYLYSQTHVVGTNKQANSMLSWYYNGSLVLALQLLFPNIGIAENKFSFVPRNYWADEGNRRKLLIDFAYENQFDPLLPYNWYNLSRTLVISRKGMQSMLANYYNGSIGKALLALFPFIGLDKTKLFPPRKQSKLNNKNRKGKDQDIDRDRDKQRELFVHFAKKKNFDPLVASNWYSLLSTSQSLVGPYKGISAMISKQYNGSLRNALLHLFPDIGL